ncbi:hypothetical protein WA158_007276 [Blastocystis sp. Blastoise]
MTDNYSTIEKTQLREYISQFDNSIELTPDVENLILEMAKDFVDDVAEMSCRIAKQRKAQSVEPDDILCYLERSWDINIPGNSLNAIIPSQSALATIVSSQGHSKKVTSTEQTELVAARDDNDSVLLNSIRELIFYNGLQTTTRKDSAINQMTCIGGTAGCSLLPEVAYCYNKVEDNLSEPDWKCKAKLPANITLGDIAISCEGYNSSDDIYVLDGSCGLEYTLNYVIPNPSSSSSSSSVSSSISSSSFKLFLLRIAYNTGALSNVFIAFSPLLLVYKLFCSTRAFNSFNCSAINKQINPFILAYYPSNGDYPSFLYILLSWGLLGYISTLFVRKNKRRVTTKGINIDF